MIVFEFSLKRKDSLQKRSLGYSTITSNAEIYSNRSYLWQSIIIELIISARIPVACAYHQSLKLDMIGNTAQVPF